MTTIFTVFLTYLFIDAVASLAVFFIFKYNKTLQSRARYVLYGFLGLFDRDADSSEKFLGMHVRLSKEIQNRQILKERVRRMV